MVLNKILWLTDIHLNFLKLEARKEFYQNIAEHHADAIVITGDIAEAATVCELLAEFSTHVNKDCYFVLGNHDYYSSDVVQVRHDILNLCAQNNKLHWLGSSEIIQLNRQTILVGQDGWADARYGDFDHSWVNLNDSQFIAELFQAACLSKTVLKYEMQKLADADAAALEKSLETAIDTYDPKKIMIATHVPPYKECCRHAGQQSDENWQPFFASKASGDVITSIATKHPLIDFLVLCGHTHTKYHLKPRENLQVKVGGAEYYEPTVQEIIDLTQTSDSTTFA